MNLSAVQLKAVQLLAEGVSEQEVSTACNCSRSTIQRWKRSVEFRKEIEKSKQQAQSLFKEEIQKTQEAGIKKEVGCWEIKRQELREKEWRISENLFDKGEEMLKVSLEERKWTFRDAFLCLQLASELARKSSQTWDEDLNSALHLVRSFGYEIIDSQQDLSVVLENGNGDICSGVEKNPG